MPLLKMPARLPLAVQERQSGLLQQGVAAGQQHAVEVVDERLHHAPVVDPGADRPDQALLAPAGHQRQGLAQHLLGEPLRLVQVQDVDALDAQAAQAALEATLHAVGAEVVIEAAGHAAGQDAHLGVEHVAVTRHAAQGDAEPLLGQSVAVQRRGIEEPHAARQGVLDGGHRLRFRHLAVQPGAEPDPRHLQASFAAARGPLLLLLHDRNSLPCSQDGSRDRYTGRP